MHAHCFVRISRPAAWLYTARSVAVALFVALACVHAHAVQPVVSDPLETRAEVLKTSSEALRMHAEPLRTRAEAHLDSVMASNPILRIIALPDPLAVTEDPMVSIEGGYRVDPNTARHIIVTPVRPDTVDVIRLDRKNHFWRAAAEVFGFNMGLWAHDRFIEKGFYAYINLKTIRANFKHGFEWDDDYLGTNMFLHPYMGSLYFNAGRSNGFIFWQSELFAIAGSAMWELFMENEYPSTNDVIATPVGGAAIGEVLYRTSDLILDDRTSGWERFGREFAAFLVSPMRGFTRIVTGHAWENRSTTGRMFGIPPISIDLSVGARTLAMHDNTSTSKMGGAARLDIQYGDKYADRTRLPYDWFSFRMDLNCMPTQPFLDRLEIIARLLGRNVHDSRKCQINVGFYQHFDYFDSDTITRDQGHGANHPCTVPYKLGTPASVGFGTMARYMPDRNTRLEGYAHLNGVVIAGILTDFYRNYHRNYNWGSGFSVKSGYSMSFDRNRFLLSLANQLYWLYTRNGRNSYKNMSLEPSGQPTGLEGDNSKAWFNHFEVTASCRLYKRLYLTAGLDVYKRKTRYGRMSLDDRPRGAYGRLKVTSSQFGLYLMVTYKL